MTKEEKIKEAYGENWELVKDKVNKDGWIKDREFTFSDFAKGTDWQTTYYDDEWYDTRRPMSLKGIEDNNGWIKIESEDDFPKTENHYWVMEANRDNEPAIKAYLHENKTWEIEEWEIFVFVTHYQPIVKPKPPIY